MKYPNWRIILLLLFLSSIVDFCYAYTDSQIANAIYLAEGGARARVPYGILSVKVRDKQEAREICLRTIRNNRKRVKRQTRYTEFLEFLASRFCPVNCENDNGSNRYWLKNVKYFLRKGARNDKH